MTEQTVRIKLSWWVTPYVHTLAVLCVLFNTEPDYEKVKRTIARGIKKEVIK